MKPLPIKTAGAPAPAVRFPFDQLDDCKSVHPVNGERCECRGQHAEHWAVYEPEPGVTMFSRWNDARSHLPPRYSDEKLYSPFQKWLIMALAVFSVLAVLLIGLVWLSYEGVI